MRTRWDWSYEKKLPNFSLMGIFPYWVLYMYCKRLSMRVKISWKELFSKVDLFSWRSWEVDPMLEIDEFDPKRHPKSLVSILSTCQNKIFRLYNISAFCGPNAFPQYPSSPPRLVVSFLDVSTTLFWIAELQTNFRYSKRFMRCIYVPCWPETLEDLKKMLKKNSS